MFLVWGEIVTFNLSFTGGDGSYYLTKELKNPGEEYAKLGHFGSQFSNSFDFSVGGMMPGTYRMRVQVINAATDKPVKSNSVKFTVSANTGLGWQEGGENYGNIQTCTVYAGTCTVFNSCSVYTSDPGIVFGGGY